MKKKQIIIAVTFIVIALTISCIYFSKKNYYDIMAVTGATPLAVKQDVDKKITLEVSGLTKKTYRFDRDALNAFASVYLRTQEVGVDGESEGTYRYTGIPVLHILEGVAPEKPKTSLFDRPIDMVVTFVSSSGKQAHFSYGELTMADDSKPVILAYSRKELKPSKETKGKPYILNKHKDDVKGLRLVCPGDNNTARYLDDVKKIVLREITVDNKGLPEMTKGFRCFSDEPKIVFKGKTSPLDLKNAETAIKENWFRTGHGQGFKGISTASGYNLRSVLKKNFPGAGENNFFLFVACDGYRTMFSGREIFSTEAGKNMMIIKKVDGYDVRGGITAGPVSDFYVDRETWGLTHIIMIEKIDDIK
jgi:hypothetical protein